MHPSIQLSGQLLNNNYVPRIITSDAPDFYSHFINVERRNLKDELLKLMFYLYLLVLCFLREEPANYLGKRIDKWLNSMEDSYNFSIFSYILDER